MLDANLIQAFAISLPSAQRRRSDLSACLDGNIAYEFVDAIPGADLHGRELEYCRQIYSPRLFRNLTLNELGCSLSHRKALVRFTKTSAEFGLILEDDAHIAHADFLRIQEVVRAFRAFDILKVGGNGQYTVDAVRVGNFSGVDVLAVAKFGAGANAYIVSRPGAWKLINTILPIREHYDGYLRNIYQHQCAIFETSPRLTSLQPECLNSTIGGNRDIYRYSTSIMRNLEAAVFRAKHNVMRRVFNLRRFGFAYITKAGFTKLVSVDPPIEAALAQESVQDTSLIAPAHIPAAAIAPHASSMRP